MLKCKECYFSILKHNIKKTQQTVQKQPPEVFCKKGILKNFPKFTGKQLCQILFLNKVAGRRDIITGFK